MDALSIRRILQEVLKIRKEVIALKQVKEEPSGLKAYRDKNNICYMMGEVLEEGKIFYTVLDDHVCLLGCAATGLDPSLAAMNNNDRLESETYHVNTINIYPSEAVQQRAEEGAQVLFPQFKDVFKAIIMGTLGSVSEPEVFIILANAEQVHRLTRAYCYATGSFIRGYAGNGCLPHAFTPCLH